MMMRELANFKFISHISLPELYFDNLSVCRYYVFQWWSLSLIPVMS